jgi:hypothetical protein
MTNYRWICFGDRTLAPVPSAGTRYPGHGVSPRVRLADGAGIRTGGGRQQSRQQLDRPAHPLCVLRESNPRILGGRDDLAGGTCLAVNDHGVVAGLTNRPSPGGVPLTMHNSPDWRVPFPSPR